MARRESSAPPCCPEPIRQPPAASRLFLFLSVHLKPTPITHADVPSAAFVIGHSSSRSRCFFSFFSLSSGQNPVEGTCFMPPRRPSTVPRRCDPLPLNISAS
ncbi:hypothetical protein Csa_006237 [Cucumis sativus]|uniref:Uncharacterized protein n=1 Tax=Cucumis sativus TaxID=3659 RepID=A0A0A0LIA9_CUCSA|nr:hypothetical protein Csa_006237 [Cucumis sativus]